MSRTNCSVSRPAVPFPTATASAWYFATIIATAFAASSGFCSGKMTVLPRYLPVGPSIATLQPVRMPGSMASTAFSPSGAARSRWRRFSANTSTAARSASDFFSSDASISQLGARSRL